MHSFGYLSPLVTFDYLWLPLVTFGYLWLAFLTFPYLSLLFLSFLLLSQPKSSLSPKYSHFFFTNYRSDNSLTSQNNISICFVHTFACRERYKNIFNFIIKRSEYFKAHYFVLKLSSSGPRPRVTGIGISIFNLTRGHSVQSIHRNVQCTLLGKLGDTSGKV